jgi:hypothetical protein
MEEIKKSKSIYNLLQEGILSQRSYNACMRNGIYDTIMMVDYYQKNGDFLKLGNIGNKSNNELIEFCNNSTSYEEPIIDNVYSNLFEKYNSLSDLGKKNIDITYETIKNQLTTRTKNVINDLETDDTFASLLKNITDNKLNFHNIPKVGVKTANEISEFFKIISSLLEKADSTINENDIVFDNFYNDILNVIKTIPLDIENTIRDNFKTREKQKFPFLLIFQNLLTQTDFLNKREKIIAFSKFGLIRSIPTLTNDEISEELGITKERVRQIALSDTILRKIIDAFETILLIFNKYGFITTFNWFSKTDLVNLDEDKINNIDNTDFSSEFLYEVATVINPEYVLQFVPDSECEIFLIKKELVNVVNLKELFSFVQSIVSKKVDETFDINLSGFLFQYFINNDYYSLFSNRVQVLVETILIKAFSIVTDISGNIIIVRNTKKKIWEEIHDILFEANCSLLINEISRKLKEKGFDIEEDSVRSHILRHDRIFILTGSSQYGLKTWENGDDIQGGTIKDLIENFLFAKKKPSHVRDITNYVQKFRDTNFASVSRNIQNDPLGKFIHFGQYFYGLSNFNYDKCDTVFKGINRHWFEILKKELFFYKSEVKLENIISFVVDKYNVLPIQVEHLILQRIEKGDIELTPEKYVKI